MQPQAQLDRILSICKLFSPLTFNSQGRLAGLHSYSVPSPQGTGLWWQGFWGKLSSLFTISFTQDNTCPHRIRNKNCRKWGFFLNRVSANSRSDFLFAQSRDLPCSARVERRGRAKQRQALPNRRKRKEGLQTWT